MVGVSISIRRGTVIVGSFNNQLTCFKASPSFYCLLSVPLGRKIQEVATEVSLGAVGEVLLPDTINVSVVGAVDVDVSVRDEGG